MPIFKSYKVIFIAKLVLLFPLSWITLGDEDKRFVTPVSLELTTFLRYPNNDWFDVYGLRLGIWIAEDRMTDVSGVSIGLLAINNDEVRGIQLAGLANTAGDMRGIQLGAFNSANNVYGVQIGFMNDCTIAFSSTMDVYGVQVGVLNSARSVRGVQVGVVNNVTGYWAKENGTGVRGLQIGILNAATNLKGVQIGVLNGHGPDCLPFLNVGW